MRNITGILIVILYFFAINVDLHAGSYVDSLKSCLTKVEDEKKVDLLNKIADCYWKDKNP